jgi:hypothetical protein
MAKAITSLALMLTSIGLTFAIPLSDPIDNESAKIADAIRVFKKDCAKADKTVCHEKGAAITVALLKFIAMVNTELEILPREIPKTKDTPDFDAWTKAWTTKSGYMSGGWGGVDDENKDKRWRARRRQHMLLQRRWAQYWTSCLNQENAFQCVTEKAALDKETYPFGRLGLAAQ